LLDLDKKEKCDIDLLLVDDPTKHACRVDNIMIELHVTFVPVDFIGMDMRSNISSPIILRRPFLENRVLLLTLRKEM
jgi:hypothetical protein